VPGVPEWCMDPTSSETSSLVVLYLIENTEELPDAIATRSIIPWLFNQMAYGHLYREVHTYTNTLFPGNRIQRVVSIPWPPTFPRSDTFGVRSLKIHVRWVYVPLMPAVLHELHQCITEVVIQGPRYAAVNLTTSRLLMGHLQGN